MTQEYPDHISVEHFDFTRTYIGKPIIGASEIIVPVEEFGILKGIFDISVATYFLSATLIYEDVIQSTRSITKYLDERGTKFGEETILTDAPFDKIDKPMFRHAIRAVSKQPFAWVSWDIIASSVRVEDRVVFKGK